MPSSVFVHFIIGSMSIRTDISDDDDFEFIINDDSEAPAFHHGNMSETGSTTDTDELSSVFAESTSASKARETVSKYMSP